MSRPHPGRVQPTPAGRGRRVNEAVTADRLTVWKRLASRNVLVADIAHQLGMTRAGLDRFIIRARKRGHPDAVYHASMRHVWHTRPGRTRVHARHETGPET